jgi:hypothetical protein
MSGADAECQEIKSFVHSQTTHEYTRDELARRILANPDQGWRHTGQLAILVYAAAAGAAFSNPDPGPDHTLGPLEFSRESPRANLETDVIAPSCYELSAGWDAPIVTAFGGALWEGPASILAVNCL